MSNFGTVINPGYIPDRMVFGPGTVVHHGNGWSTSTDPKGWSITHETGIYFPNNPIQPPNHHWNPPDVFVPSIEVPNKINHGGQLKTLNEKLRAVAKELDDAEDNSSSSASDAFVFAKILGILKSSNIEDEFSVRAQEMKNSILYFNSLREQQSKLQEYIQKQETVRTENIKQLSRRYVVENFLKFIDRGEEEVFQYAAQISAQYIDSIKGFSNLWNKHIVIPAMELYNAKYSLISVLNQINLAIKYTKTIVGSSLSGDSNMSGFGMYFHYTGEFGQALTLYEIGVHDKVRALMQKPGAFKRAEGSIQSRFISQIQRGERIDFENNYDFVEESKVPFLDPLWAIGGATIRGKLTNVKAENVDDKYRVSGVINYELYDKFTDPYDMKDLTGKEWNPNGTPYVITGEWSESVNFDVNKDVYENKIKPMLGQ
ncbi:hypothetical protein [Photorhabdus sp. CRCIA-P01]|uniref:hypothetical protein n=1 Tax=Photorhabdus sp. CRCIA-P01 TaxID=2019570 RepID=UPI000E59D26C|nr:hypothetical protein [Photorhabdus sp. CRCIA-P01]